MQKKDYRHIKKENVDPLIKYMQRKITVRMLEAHFNALPNLLRYVIKKANTDVEARLALNNFTVQARQERPSLDPGEAVFGFVANILKLNEDDSEEMQNEKNILADMVTKFCEANNLSMPEEGWLERLKFVYPDKEK
jgi:hypothetical protein